jgi:UDP-N-acetylmuramate--alanine ligase
MDTKTLHIHFVGIAGIGMSGIARILLKQGFRISGCDYDAQQPSAMSLIAEGASIYTGNNNPACHQHKADLIVYSSAISHEHPELVAARAHNIPTMPRARMLAELMRTKRSVAVAGAHGKTTTTAMIAHVVMKADYDPTVIIGGHLKTLGSNAHCGSGDILIAEADESDRSIEYLHPTIAVVTNIDYEHVNTYNDLADMQRTFATFLSHVPFYGKAIICDDSPALLELLPLELTPTLRYGFDPASDVYGHDVVLYPDHSTCVVSTASGITLGNLFIPIPGRHNVLNALGCVAACLTLKIPFNIIQQRLETFSGVDRRFTFRGTYKGADVFDDYGHHPTELAETITTAHVRTNKKLIVAFQPHRFSRTQKLWHDFIKVLSSPFIQAVIITDIYGAHESPLEGIDSARLAQEIRLQNPSLLVQYCPLDKNLKNMQDALDTIVQEGDLILVQGAGNITRLSHVLTTS